MHRKASGQSPEFGGRHMRISSAKMAIVAGGLSLLLAAPAFGHARLVSSSPANNASVEAAPAAIVLTFNERLVPTFTKAELTMPEHGGMKVAASSQTSQDGKSLRVVPARPLGKGAYKVSWSTASADGHKMSGEISFTVR
jgi:methionine-rich copper-binding protein CopC